MAPPVIDQPPAATPDPWANAPVAVGHQRRRLGWGLVALTLLGATTLVLLLLDRTAPPTAPSATSSSAPIMPDALESVPFDVTVEIAHGASMDNDGLFEERIAIPGGAIETAGVAVADVLRGYLNAAFVTPETRFSERPVSGLLSRHASAALSADDLAGLGALGISVQRVHAEPVTATAHVLTKGSDAVVVAIRYDARAQLLTEDGESVPLHQRATMVFVPEDGSWRAEAVEASLDLPLTAGEVAR